MDLDPICALAMGLIVGFGSGVSITSAVRKSRSENDARIRAVHIDYIEAQHPGLDLSVLRETKETGKE